MKCATSHSNFCSQVVLVSLHPFRCNLLLKCALQLKIAKSLKHPILNVQSRSRSSMLNYLKACRQLLLR